MPWKLGKEFLCLATYHVYMDTRNCMLKTKLPVFIISVAIFHTLMDSVEDITHSLKGQVKMQQI